MSLETLVVEVADHVAVVTLSRPEVHNALNDRMLTELRDVLAVLADDDAVGAVVFAGSGTTAFAAGADIGEVAGYTARTALDARIQRVFDDIEDFPKPTIAAVNGVALGGGCELAMSCDIRIAAETARFGLPEANLAVLPGAGGTQRLARLIGTGRAIELILTGRQLDAAEARDVGLVTSVVAPGDLLGAAREVARRILAQGPLAVRLAKLVVRTGMDADQRTGQVVERLAQGLLYTTEDKREGTTAFLQKRPPDFRGA